MNVVLISASRNPDRQTSQALAALLEGIHSGGGRGEQIFLPRLRIERCRHCEHKGPAPCQTQGRCATQDDFAAVAERIRRADAAVFATPVYFGGGAASLRAFLDRLQKTCAHPVGRDGIAGTPAVAVCIGGGAGHCAARLQAILTSCGFDVVEVLTAPRSELHLKRQLLAAAGHRLVAARPRLTPSRPKTPSGRAV